MHSLELGGRRRRRLRWVRRATTLSLGSACDGAVFRHLRASGCVTLAIREQNDRDLPRTALLRRRFRNVRFTCWWNNAATTTSPLLCVYRFMFVHFFIKYLRHLKHNTVRKLSTDITYQGGL